MNAVKHKTRLVHGGVLVAIVVCSINCILLTRLTTMIVGEKEKIMVKRSSPQPDVAVDAHDSILEEEEDGTTWSDTCQHLQSHENGKWHHEFLYNNIPSLLMQDPSIQYMYFPEELAWLHEAKQSTSFSTCTPSSDKYLMYHSVLGHQCGCGVTGFRPSHSVWVYNHSSQFSTTPTINSSPPTNVHDYFKSSSTLRLAKLIANAKATICFSGDSVDYQIYMAMHNNLRRVDQLHRQYHHSGEGLVTVVMREIPVLHTIFEAGNDGDWFVHGRRPPNDEGHAFLHAEKPPPGGFGARSMHSILETKAFFKDGQFARIRYFMSYGWSPWNVNFMEDCNIIVQNFGLHYSSNGNHTNTATGQSLSDDMLAAITYLSNFTASARRRIAVWRSALPQHFATKNGHYYGDWYDLETGHRCSRINRDASLKEQEYNSEYDTAFSKLCQSRKHKSRCNQSRHHCTINPVADVDYQTIYNFWRTNDCTQRMESERARLSNLHNQVTGTIYRWNIFNIFDVEWWHTGNVDCTHVCYVPELFEVAFERLSILLAPLLAAF